MTSIACLLALLAGAAQAHEPEWVEVRFHRVHLRNGNFIDGQMLKDTPAAVTLTLKGGEMLIRRDSIDRVEFVKMRTINEKPPVLEAPRRGGPVTEPTAKDTPGDPKPPRLGTAAGPKVEELLERLRRSSEERAAAVVDELIALGEDGALYILSRLETLNPQIRGHAFEVLAAVKAESLAKPLIELLGNKEASIRAGAVYAIGAGNRTAESTQHIRPLLRDREPRVRVAALSALQALDDPAWLGSIGELCSDPDKGVRARALTAVDALGRKHQKSEEVQRILMDSLARSSGAARAELVGAVGNLGRADIWKEIVPYMNDGEPQVRAAAVLSLTNLGVREAVPEILARFSAEGDRWPRAFLANAAQRFRLTQAIEPMIGWLSSDEPELVKAVAAALQGLTAENFGTDREKWRSWWETRKSKP